VIVATGDDFERAVAAVMYEARSIVMSCKAMEDSLAQELAALGKAAPEPASEAPQKEQDGEVGAQWMENWYDGIGYCEYCIPTPLHVGPLTTQAPGTRLVTM
jgi:hypothetical protein